MAKHLTPKERAALVARYQEIANASAVAEEFGVSVHTVIRSAERAGVANKATLHARAVETAIRKARRSLARRVESIDMYLLNAADTSNDRVPGVIGLEPKDFAAVLNAQGNVTARLLDTQERLERSHQARLTRDKTRAEIDFLKARTNALDGISKVLANATDEELAVVSQVIERARARGSVAGGQSGASAPQPVDDSADEPR